MGSVQESTSSVAPGPALSFLCKAFDLASASRDLLVQQPADIPNMAQDTSDKKRPKSFDALTPELSQWILDFTNSMGFARTTPVQAMAIPLLMGNKDLVVEVCESSRHTSVAYVDLLSGCNGKWQDTQFPYPAGGANSKS